MTFFVTFEHALAKAFGKLKQLAVSDLPKVQAAVTFAQKAIPTVETVATILDPAAAGAIIAIGNAGDSLLAKVTVVLHDQAAFQAALASGTVTIKMATDEIQDVKSLTPTVLGVVSAIGLGHTIPVVPAVPVD
jgi:hypothetical protein